MERQESTPRAAFSPFSKFGPRVRLFSDKDVPQLVSVAARPLMLNVSAEEVATRLNQAFFGASVYADLARAQLAPEKLKTTCQTIANNAQDLLQTLGMPCEPRDYTRDVMRSPLEMDERLSRNSAIGHQLCLLATSSEPLPQLEYPVPRATRNPERLGLEETERFVQRMWEAEKRVPLTPRMVPASIAERTLSLVGHNERVHSIARNLHKDLGEDLAAIEARMMVTQLLSALSKQLLYHLSSGGSVT